MIYAFIKLKRGNEEKIFNVWSDGTVYEGIHGYGKKPIKNFSKIYKQLKADGWKEVK